MINGAANYNYQTGAMIELGYTPANTDTFGNAAHPFPTNVDIVLGATSVLSGSTGITLGNNRTLTTDWGASNTLTFSSSTVLSAAPGAASVRLAGANGQTLTVNGPLELGSTQLLINDTPSYTLYVNYQDSLGNYTRQPGGSLLNGTVVLSNSTATASVIPSVFVKGGTLRLSGTGALGTTPLPMTVGASTANAGTAQLDLYGTSLAVASLSGGSLGAVTNSASTSAVLTVGVPASSTMVYAGALVDGSGSLGLIVNGPGTQVLSGPNTFSGGTTINGGTLAIGSGGASGTLGGAAGAVVNNATLAFNRSDSGLSVGNSISGSGSVLQLGTGVTALGGNNSYTGPTAVMGGTLLVNGALSPSSTVTVSSRRLPRRQRHRAAESRRS